MFYSEATALRHMESYGYYCDKEETKVLEHSLLILNFMISYNKRFITMKSWLSNLLQPCQPVPQSGVCKVSNTEDTFRGNFFMPQSKPVKINGKPLSAPGSNLYDTYSTFSSSDPPNKKILERNRPSLFLQCMAVRRVSGLPEFKSCTFVTQPTCCSASPRNGLRNNFSHQNSDFGSFTDLFKLPYSSHSAPSVMYGGVRCAEKMRNHELSQRLGTVMNDCKETDMNTVHPDKSPTSVGFGAQTLTVTVHCTEKSSVKSDKNKCLLDSSPLDSPSTMKKEDKREETCPLRPFITCKNPIISYILGGCTADSDQFETSCYDSDWSDLQSESEDFNDFDFGNDIGSFKEMPSRLSPGFSSDPSSSRLSDSTQNDVESHADSDEDGYSSTSDCWSDEENDQEIFSSNSTGACDMKKPFCANPLINFILNCDEVDCEPHDSIPSVTCPQFEVTHWKNFLKSKKKSSSNASSTKTKTIKVTFDDKPQVHHMCTWSFAYRQSRRGPWESYARDRERFRFRALAVERAISWCFSPNHREMIWKKLAAAQCSACY